MHRHDGKRLDELDGRERGLLSEVCARLEPLAISSDKRAVLRFLVARGFDVGQAEAMVRAHLEWREKTFPIRPSQFVEDPFFKSSSVQVFGTDVGGRPCLVVRSGLFCPAERDLEASLAGVVYIMQSLVEAADAQGGATDGKVTVIYDRQGFSVSRNLDRQLLKAIGQVLSENYPERLHRVLIFPCGLVLRGVWRVFQFFFDPVTRAKVKMLGSQEDFAQYIAPDQRLEAQGGTGRRSSQEPAITLASMPIGRPDPWAEEDE